MIKVVFMGTPDFAVEILKGIDESGAVIAAVVTKPDKKSGRGSRLNKSAVKIWAEQNNIEVLQPIKAREEDFIQRLNEIKPDVIITAAYGNILRKVVLDLPLKGCINVHCSILPKLRGASPIQSALLNGDDKTGISLMYMDVGMDTGDIIKIEEIPINADDNAGTLFDKMAALGRRMIKELMPKFEEGKPDAVPQDDSLATYCSKIDKSIGNINWNDDAADIVNLIRALTPQLGAFSFLNGKRIKIVKAEAINKNSNFIPGFIERAELNNGLIVSCGKGALKITSLQPSGKKVMETEAYLRGAVIKAGDEFKKDADE